jgi:hypothetical protein
MTATTAMSGLAGSKHLLVGTNVLIQVSMSALELLAELAATMTAIIVMSGLVGRAATRNATAAETAPVTPSAEKQLLIVQQTAAALAGMNVPMSVKKNVLIQLITEPAEITTVTIVMSGLQLKAVERARPVRTAAVSVNVLPIILKPATVTTSIGIIPAVLGKKKLKSAAVIPGPAIIAVQETGFKGKRSLEVVPVIPATVILNGRIIKTVQP